jgi:hypothetical protein
MIFIRNQQTNRWIDVTGDDVEAWSKARRERGAVEPRTVFWSTLESLLLAGFCCLFLIGCGDSGELAALKSSLANAQESIVETQATQIDKTDEAIGILRDNTTALAAIKSQIDALQVVSKTANSEEVIKSAPESPAKANTTPDPVEVATPGTSSRIASDGTRLRWNIEGNWNPTILETSAHLREHGINTDGMTHQQMADLHASIHDGTNGGQPVTGGIFPNNRTSAITSQRTSVRSLPQRVSFFGRAKYSTRQSCPSGRCPQR